MFRWICWEKMKCPIFKPKKDKNMSKNHKNPFEDMRIFYGKKWTHFNPRGVLYVYLGHHRKSIAEVLNVWPTWRSPSLGAEPMELQGLVILGG